MNAKFEQARNLMREAVLEEYQTLVGRDNTHLGFSMNRFMSANPVEAARENRSLRFQVANLTKMSAVLSQMDSCDPATRRY
jgi:hypothetical protein